jgi:hypothetical protein
VYIELWELTRSVVRDKRTWTDGELWTAIIAGIAARFWFYSQPDAVVQVRHHFAPLLTAASIVFGFVLNSYVFYVRADADWSKDGNVKEVTALLINWHAWTILCLLGVVGLILGLWALPAALPEVHRMFAPSLYGFLVFLAAYSGFQVMNHTMTVRWVFFNWHRLTAPSTDKQVNSNCGSPDTQK